MYLNVNIRVLFVLICGVLIMPFYKCNPIRREKLQHSHERHPNWGSSSSNKLRRSYKPNLPINSDNGFIAPTAINQQQSGNIASHIGQSTTSIAISENSFLMKEVADIDNLVVDADQPGGQETLDRLLKYVQNFKNIDMENAADIKVSGSAISSSKGTIKIYSDAKTQVSSMDKMDIDISSTTPPNRSAGEIRTPIDSSTLMSTAATSSTPESATASSSTPGNAAASSSTPENAASSSSTPESATASSSTPESAAVPSSTPESAAGSPSTPDSAVASTSTPESAAASSSTPDSAAASSSTPDSAAVSSSTPHSAVASTSTPESAVASSSTPDSAAASSSTPESAAASSSTPESAAASSSTPESAAASSSTPDSAAASSSTPDSAAGSSSTPESAAVSGDGLRDGVTIEGTTASVTTAASTEGHTSAPSTAGETTLTSLVTTEFITTVNNDVNNGDEEPKSKRDELAVDRIHGFGDNQMGALADFDQVLVEPEVVFPTHNTVISPDELKQAHPKPEHLTALQRVLQRGIQYANNKGYGYDRSVGSELSHDVDKRSNSVESSAFELLDDEDTIEEEKDASDLVEVSVDIVGDNEEYNTFKPRVWPIDDKNSHDVNIDSTAVSISQVQSTTRIIPAEITSRSVISSIPNLKQTTTVHKDTVYPIKSSPTSTIIDEDGEFVYDANKPKVAEKVKLSPLLGLFNTYVRHGNMAIRDTIVGPTTTKHPSGIGYDRTHRNKHQRWHHKHAIKHRSHNIRNAGKF